jgi:tetratricopeptide (TPR) repeat protein
MADLKNEKIQQQALESLFAQKRFPEALTMAEKLTADFPDSYHINILYVKVLTELNRLGDAEDAAKNLMQIYPDNINLLSEMGTICLKLNKYDDAIEYYNKILFLDPFNTAAKETIDKISSLKKTAETREDKPADFMSYQSEKMIARQDTAPEPVETIPGEMPDLSFDPAMAETREEIEPPAMFDTEPELEPLALSDPIPEPEPPSMPEASIPEAPPMPEPPPMPESSIPEPSIPEAPPIPEPPPTPEPPPISEASPTPEPPDMLDVWTEDPAGPEPEIHISLEEETPETVEITDIPGTGEIPEIMEMPELRTGPETPEVMETEEAPELPEQPVQFEPSDQDTAKMPEFKPEPVTPDMMGVVEIGETAELDTLPEVEIPETAPAQEPSPPMEYVAEPEPVIEEPAAGGKDENDMEFVTESAAELYLSQGLYEDALQIFKKLYAVQLEERFLLKIKQLSAFTESREKISRLSKFLELIMKKGENIV